jgi:predicted nucleotidyltransferase component of viral defense system
MNDAIKVMLAPYNCKTPDDYKNAFKEIVQEITLLALARQNFFSNAAFYGGTALRLCHGLNRFSEDLDFTILNPDKKFSLENYLKGIENELSTYDLKVSVEQKKKTIESSIESAFLKANTIEILLAIEGWEKKKIPMNKNDRISIKLEIDTEPPTPPGETEIKYATLPIPFSYKILTLPSLFAGKLHAVLCREYKSGRVKGRDFYDFIWYLNSKPAVDFPYLKAKLIQSGHWNEKEEFNLNELKKLLREKFSKTNWENAKKDVLPFIKDPFELEVWSKDFFLSLVDRIDS